MRHSVSNNELALGTDRVYGAIHQFGGKIEHAARLQQVYFRQDKDVLSATVLCRSGNPISRSG